MKNNIRVIILLLCLGAFISCIKEQKQQNIIAIVDATLIDLDNFGNSSNDLQNTVVLIRNGKIFKIGTRETVKIPKESKIIEARNKFLIPGMIDGFATLNNQNYTNAFLYMGVTSIVGLESPRRGKLFRKTNPSPKIHQLQTLFGTNWDSEWESIVNWKSSNELKKEIDSFAKTNTKALLVYYDVIPEQLDIISKEAKKQDLVTIGELGHTTYQEAVTTKIDAFVHTSRYSIDVIPNTIRLAYKNQPFGKPRLHAYKYYEKFDPNKDARLKSNSEVFKHANLMPTWGLFYPSFEFARSPWAFPIARLIHEDSLHMPLDKVSGKWHTLK